MKLRRSLFARAAFLVALPLFTALAGAAPAEYWVYFGTYTARDSKGIYVSKLDLETGKLSLAKVVAEVKHPSFLAVHPDRKFLYCVNEVATFGGEPTGVISSFKLNSKTGALEPLNHQ